MSTNTTAYGDINQRTAAFAAVEQLEYAHPVIVLNLFAQSKPLPKNKADTVKFRRPVPFSAALTPLVEGVTPTAQKMSYQDVTCVMKQWGAVTEITDKVADIAEDPVLKDANRLSGEQAGFTIEMVTYGVVKGGTSVAYANGAARNQVNTPISLNKVRAVVRTLTTQKAMKITSILAPSANYNTKAVEAGFVAVTHTNVAADIRSIPGFVPVAEYGQRQPLCPQEIGAVEDVRFVVSPELTSFADAGAAQAGSGVSMLSTSGTNADVYPVLIFGKDAFGSVPLKGPGAITPMVLNPGTPSKSDPLGQRGYVSWKAWFNAVILNDNWMVRLEVAATNL